MSILSKERIIDELNKILVCDRPSIGFRLLEDTGLLEYILPQLSKLKGVETMEGKGHKENFSHTLEVLDNVALFCRQIGQIRPRARFCRICPMISGRP